MKWRPVAPPLCTIEPVALESAAGFVGRSRKALQNTGLADFRQYPFVDSPYTHGYCLGFLTAHFGGPFMGGVAQLGERLNGIQEVRGSIPLASITVSRCCCPDAPKSQIRQR
jgi:hypothetical protein